MKDPYVYEDSNVLINNANIKDQKKLDDFETTITSFEIIDIINNPFDVCKVNDIFKIHKKLFSEVYSWAGKARTINIYKEEIVLSGLSVEYSDYGDITRDLEKIQKDMDSFDFVNSSKKELVSKIVRIVSSIWKVHAFREGNTRTICVFLYLFLKHLNLKLNIDFIGIHSKYFRNALVLASIGEYSEYNHLEEILKDSISKKIVIDNIEKYQTINGYELDKYKYNYHNIKK